MLTGHRNGLLRAFEVKKYETNELNNVACIRMVNVICMYVRMYVCMYVCKRVIMY